MDDRQLLGLHQPLRLRAQVEEETLLQHVQRMEMLIQEQRAFLRRQEAKVRAAESQDAIDARTLPLRTATRALA